MSVRSRANMKSTIDGSIIDNSAKSITPSIVRSVLNDIADSFYNTTDDLLNQFTSTTVIPTAQVLTLNATPVNAIAAQGANKAIAPISIIVKLKYNSVAYATNTILDFKIGSQTIASISSFLNGTASQYAILNLFNPTASVSYASTTTVKRSDGSTPTDGNITTSAGVMQTSVSQGTRVENISSISISSGTPITTFNTPLVVQVRTGNPTAGNSDISIFVNYMVIDMS